LPMGRQGLQIKVRLGQAYATGRGRGAKSCKVPNPKISLVFALVACF
jgi:hypothetical protein